MKKYLIKNPPIVEESEIPERVDLKEVDLFRRTFLDYDDIRENVRRFSFIKEDKKDENGLDKLSLEMVLNSGTIIVVKCLGLVETRGRSSYVNDFVLSWRAEIYPNGGGSLSYYGHSSGFLSKMRWYARTERAKVLQ